MTVPLWFHVACLLLLVASNAVTAWLAVRRIRDLQDALAAKHTLMGRDR